MGTLTMNSDSLPMLWHTHKLQKKIITGCVRRITWIRLLHLFLDGKTTENVPEKDALKFIINTQIKIL